MTSYIGIFRSIFETAVEVWPKRRITSSFLQDFFIDIKEYGRISARDVFCVCCIACFVTILRSVLTAFIFKPFAISMKFTAKNIPKFSESFWKFLYYLFMYTYTCYLLFGTNYPFYHDPTTMWTEDWSVGMSVPTDIYYLYCIQTGFYIHSIYATFYMDPWRRDSIAMIIHHVLTIFLIAFSFAVRYYKPGVVVLFLHDICDVVLELTKMFICWKTRDKKHYYIFEILVNIGFLLFAFSWFFCRLYLFPYKVLHPAGCHAVRVLPHAPFFYFFNGMLWLLFIMDVWWFHFIILLIWRVLTGGKGVEDTREVEIQEEPNKTSLSCKDDIHSATAEHNGSNGTTMINGNKHFSKENVGMKNGKESHTLTKNSNGLVDNIRQRQSDKSSER